MTLPFLVTGGTGTLGQHVVPRLRESGTDVRVLTRKERAVTDGVDRVEFVTGDLATGDGLEAAMDGVETIVHLGGSAKGDGDKARNLMRAASQAKITHVVYISVVGADRIPVVNALDRAMFGYFAEKRAAEQVIESSGLPWTTLRATQFHDIVLTMAQQMAKMPVMPAFAGMRLQPVDSAEVAQRLVELAHEEPAGLVPDLAGPRVYEMKELFRGYLRAAGRRRAIMPVWLPGRAARAYRTGANLAPERAVGTRTWEDFLAARLA